MTDMEKKVLVRLCAKIFIELDKQYIYMLLKINYYAMNRLFEIILQIEIKYLDFF